MNRRYFLRLAGTVALLSAACSRLVRNTVAGSMQLTRRLRAGEPGWPSAASWAELRRRVQGRLLKVESPLDACRNAPDDPACRDLAASLKNPFYIGDHPGLTQTLGWVDAWTSKPSVYAVAAQETADVAAAVNFAREHKLRLVVKGGGHSYQGTSNAPDSLLIWTRAMKDVVIHDAFVPQGCAAEPQPAVTVGAGALWLHAYDAVTTRNGRYVQGGGCTTVGVAGLIQSGGFGSFSKGYGIAAAGLLEAEVVTADGVARIANACTNPDLFWALKGGGGGSFGVITRLTLRTRELPEYFGGVFAGIKASSDAAFRSLIAEFMSFYQRELGNPNWGEQVRWQPANVMQISMLFQGVDQTEATAVWQPFVDWVNGRPQSFTWLAPLTVAALPARHFWDAAFLQQNAPAFIYQDQRPGAPAGNFAWAGDREEAGQYLHGYRSVWLPARLLQDDSGALTDALFASSRHWGVALHFNKGLADAPETDRRAALDTAMNPLVVDAFALAIIAGNSTPSFPAEPDLADARRHARAIDQSMTALLSVVEQPGSYVSESSYFEEDWQRSFWGTNYERLAAVKARYDADGLFVVHHGVGSEHWSEDGFVRVL